MLLYDIGHPTRVEDGAAVAVFLHGRGSHRGDLQALRPLIPESWALVTPQAPHPGHTWGYGPGWAWYRYVEADTLVEETLTESLLALDAFLEELPAVVGFSPGKIVLGGFSQGGTTSVAYALTRPGTVAAAINLSGFLTESIDIPSSALSSSSTPIFWGHGTRDPNIPFSLAVKGRERLAGEGVPLVSADYDIGHWIVPEEVAAAVDFVESG